MLTPHSPVKSHILDSGPWCLSRLMTVSQIGGLSGEVRRVLQRAGQAGGGRSFLGQGDGGFRWVRRAARHRVSTRPNPSDEDGDARAERPSSGQFLVAEDSWVEQPSWSRAHRVASEGSDFGPGLKDLPRREGLKRRHYSGEQILVDVVTQQG